MSDDPKLPLRNLKIPQYCETYNVGRNQAYAEMRSGLLHSVLVGRTRLIPVDSAEARFKRPSDPLLPSNRTKNR